jgi:hypothetical protein
MGRLRHEGGLNGGCQSTDVSNRFLGFCFSGCNELRWKLEHCCFPCAGLPAQASSVLRLAGLRGRQHRHAGGTKAVVPAKGAPRLPRILQRSVQLWVFRRSCSFGSSPPVGRPYAPAHYGGEEQQDSRSVVSKISILGGPSCARSAPCLAA